MTQRIKVEVVAPDRRLVGQEADEVIAPGADGLFGVRVGHTAYLALLQPGLLTIVDAGAQKKFFVTGGVAEGGANHVRVLAEGAEPLEGIQLADARRMHDEAKKKLDAISPTAADYAAQAKRVQIAARRVEVVEKR